MGDLLFNRAHPAIDRTNGASIVNWIVVLQQVARELPGNTIYIFGHAGRLRPRPTSSKGSRITARSCRGPLARRSTR